MITVRNVADIVGREAVLMGAQRQSGMRENGPLVTMADNLEFHRQVAFGRRAEYDLQRLIDEDVAGWADATGKCFQLVDLVLIQRYGQQYTERLLVPHLELEEPRRVALGQVFGVNENLVVAGFKRQADVGCALDIALEGFEARRLLSVDPYANAAAGFQSEIERSRSLRPERAFQPSPEMRRHMPEAGELDAAVRAGKIEAFGRPGAIGRERSPDHGRPEGLAAGQVADIDETVDETIVHAVFCRRGLTGKIAGDEAGNGPCRDRLPSATLYAGAISSGCLMHSVFTDRLLRNPMKIFSLGLCARYFCKMPKNIAIAAANSLTERMSSI